MFGIGFPELIVICIVALIFIGPKKLPDLMRQGGKLFVQLRRTANDVRSTFDQVVHEAEEEMRRSEAEALRQAILADHIKAPKLLDATPTTTESAADDHHHIDAHHHDPHADLGQLSGHPDSSHPDGAPQTVTQDQHDPHRPDGAQPFQPNLLGSMASGSESPREEGSNPRETADPDPTTKAHGISDTATADAPSKPKDPTVS